MVLACLSFMKHHLMVNIHKNKTLAATVTLEGQYEHPVVGMYRQVGIISLRLGPFTANYGIWTWLTVTSV